MSKTTEWKSIQLRSDTPDFSGAKEAALEHDGNTFLQLTLKLRDGRTVRIRKDNYSVALEELVIPMKTGYIATIGEFSRQFDSEEAAQKSLEGYSGEVTESKVSNVDVDIDVDFNYPNFRFKEIK